MAEQTKAQKKRAEARERRRGQPPEDQSRENQDDGALAGNEEQPLDAVKQAREQLEGLLEFPVESVSGFERTRNGWLITLEVLELSRIPESTDVLASYEMELDDDRNLVRYIRGRRYHRSQADRGDQS